MVLLFRFSGDKYNKKIKETLIEEADKFIYYNNGITSFVKAMLTFGTLLVILQSHKWLRNVHSYYKQGEYFILLLSTLVGMYFMMSARHFLLFFIGMELAEAFHKRGIKTSIVEMQDRILPQMLDKELADLVKKPLEKAGINLYLEEKTVGFVATDGVVSAVQTDKREIPAQLVIVAVGVRPNVELAKAAGLEIGPTGCIAVNEYLQTSDPAIYAGGDCAENTHRVSGAKIFTPMGSTANKHGRVIADNICGDAIKYPGVLGTGVCQILDWQAGATGLNERTAAAAGFKFKAVVVPGSDRLGYMPGG